MELGSEPPAITTRGFKETQIDLLIDWISDVLNDINNRGRQQSIKDAALQLCREFPIYKGI